jgi:hypothetical protein
VPERALESNVPVCGTALGRRLRFRPPFSVLGHPQIVFRDAKHHALRFGVAILRASSAPLLQCSGHRGMDKGTQTRLVAAGSARLDSYTNR